MPRDWPDSRFPDKPLSKLEIGLIVVLVASGYGSIIWGAVQVFRQAIG